MHRPVGQVVGLGRRRHQQPRLVAEHQPHPPVGRPDGARPHPHQLARRAQGVEVGGPVLGQPGRQDLGLQHRRRQRCALQLGQHVDQRVHAPPGRPQPVPLAEEPGQRGPVDRLDLLAQPGQRPPPQLAQDLDVAPLALDPVGPELALHDPALVGQGTERGRGPRRGHVVARRHLGGRERPVGAGEPPHQVDEGRVHRVGEHRGQPHRDRGAQGVAQAAGVLGRRHPVVTPDRRPERPPLGHQAVDPGRRPVARAAGIQLVERQRTQPPQQVVQLVGVAGPAAVGERLELELEVGQRPRVEQLAQLVGAEQVVEQVAVEGQGRGPALGQRGVALVHVDGDPPEQQRLRERRGVGRLDLDHPHPPGPDVAQHLAQRRQVEHVVEALAGGLQQDGEAGVAARHRQQVGRALALLPQRRAPVGPAPGQQQRPGRGLAEAAGEQRGVGQLGHHDVGRLLGVDREGAGPDAGVVERLGQPDGDAVVAPDHLDLDAPPLGQAGLDGHAPRGVDLGAERGQDAHPPVADLVAEPLDHDRAVVGHRARWPRPARRGRRPGWPRRARRARGPSAAGRSRRRPAGPAARGRTRPAPGPARAGGPARRRARTASCPAGPAPG